MKNLCTLIINQIISEKGTSSAEKNNQYLFRVAPDANKIEIKYAVEKIFNVKVQCVQVLNRLGKAKRRGMVAGMSKGYRRAIVRLIPGNSISLT